MRFNVKSIALLCAVTSCFVACNAPETDTEAAPERYDSARFERPDMTIGEVALPKGFARVEAAEGSYAEYLRALPLRPQGAKVRTCAGRMLEDQSVASAVLFYAVPMNGRLMAADVPVNMYSDYLFKSGRADEIAFNLPGNFEARYSAWRDGQRFKDVESLAVLDDNAPADSSFMGYRGYLDKVYHFAKSNTLPEMFSEVAEADVKIGDFAVTPDKDVLLVADMAVKGSKKALLLICGGSPSTELYVLASPGKKGSTPWHRCDKGSYDFGECAFYCVEN